MQEAKKSGLPPSVANASHEELQRVLLDALKKLKARDRKIAELSTALEKAAEGAPAEPPAEQPNGQDTAALERQLQVAIPLLALCMNLTLNRHARSAVQSYSSCCSRVPVNQGVWRHLTMLCRRPRGRWRR